MVAFESSKARSSKATVAKAVRPSGDTEPGPGGCTDRTCGSPCTVRRARRMRAWRAGSRSVPARAWKTTCAVSPDCWGKRSCRSWTARWESDFGSEKFCLNVEPAAPAATPEPIRIAIQPRTTRRRWRTQKSARRRTSVRLGLVAQHLVGDGEGRVGRRHARVDRDVDQHLADLLGREAVAQGAAHVHGQLLAAAERGEHGQGHGAARPAVVPRPRPHLAPGRGSDVLLPRAGEVARAARRPIDVVVAEGLVAGLYGGLVP